MATKKLGIDIVAKDKSQQALNQVQGNLNKTKSSVLNLKNALIGLGAGLAIKSIVNVAQEMESLQVRFKFLFGTVEEGKKAFDNLATFASKVPFSLDAIAKASGNLAVVSKDAEDLNRILKITGNVAAFTGLDFETTGSQIQRAFAGGISAADIFREKGLRDILGFEAGAKVSIADTIKAFEEKFGEGGELGDITDDLANTFEGTLSMLGDKLLKFQTTIADGGFFPEIKRQFGDLNKTLEENEAVIEQLAIKIGLNLAKAVSMVVKGLKLLKDNSDLVFTVFAGIISLKVATAFMGIATAITTMKFAMIGFNTATKANIIFGGIALFIGSMAFLTQKFKLFKNELTDGTLLSTVTDFESADAAAKKLGKQLELLKQQRENLDGSVTVKNIDGKATVVDVDTSGLDLEISQTQNMLDVLSIKRAEFNYNNLLNMEKTSKKMQEITDAQYNKEIKTIQDSFLTETMLIKKKIDEDIARIDKFLEEEENITKAQKEELEDFKYKIYLRGMSAMGDLHQLELDAAQKHSDELKRIAEETDTARIEAIQKEGSILENLKENYAAFFKDFNEGKLVADALTDTFSELTKGIGDAIAQSIVFGKSFKQTFGDVARQALASLISALVQVGVQMAVNAIISAMGMKASEESTVKSLKAIKKEAAPTAFLVSLATSGTNSIGAIAGTIATFFVTKMLSGRRTGGQVTGGTPYLVGEQGPELFQPNQSGTIIPNDKVGGGQTINVNIHANDTQGFDELLIKRRATIVNVINDALNSQGKEALV